MMKRNSDSAESSNEEGVCSDKSPGNSTKRKRDSTEDEDQELDDETHSSTSDDLDQPPIVANGMVEFSLAPVNALLVCKLCDGYYRDPYTIAECLHTFCKSCLFSAFNSGCRNCPNCTMDLGTDPFRTALSDRTLEELVDKVLFPRLHELDEQNERYFYKEQGIQLKPEFRDEEVKLSAKKNHPKIVHHSVDDELNFTVLPESVPGSGYEMPALPRPCIRTSGRFRIALLKRYILKQLKISAGDPALIEVLCNGGPVGNELSLTFILRTIWLHPKEDLKLTYRFADDY